MVGPGLQVWWPAALLARATGGLSHGGPGPTAKSEVGRLRLLRLPGQATETAASLSATDSERRRFKLGGCRGRLRAREVTVTIANGSRHGKGNVGPVRPPAGGPPTGTVETCWFSLVMHVRSFTEEISMQSSLDSRISMMLPPVLAQSAFALPKQIKTLWPRLKLLRFLVLEAL